MKKTLLIAGLGFWALTNSAQTTFQTIIKGADDEHVRGIIEENGVLTITGRTYTYSQSPGDPDGFIAKVACDGSIVDFTTIGDSASFDFTDDLVPDGQGGYILVGTSDEFSTLGSGYFTRLGANYNQVWAKSYLNGFANPFQSVRSIGNDQFIALDGFNLSSIGIVIFDVNGNVIKNLVVNNDSLSVGPETTCLPTSDGSFLVYGNTNEGSSASDWIIYKIDTAGTGSIDWSVASNNPTYSGLIYDAIETSSGYYFVGQASFTASADMFISKRNKTTGAPIWTKYYSGNDFDRILRIDQQQDGSLTIGGYTRSFGQGMYDVFLANVDSADGAWNWGKVYGSTGEDRMYNFISTSDGGYAIAASTTSFGATMIDGYLIKTDANGNSGCHESSFTLAATTGNFIEFTPSDNILNVATYLDHGLNTTTPSISQDQECVQCDLTATMDLGSSPYCSKDTTWFTNTTNCSDNDSSMWYVDNNLVGTGSPFGYVFGATGNYDVELRSYTGACDDTISSSINVIESPTADFSFSENGLTVTFTDNSTGTINSWDWDFGDTNTDNTQNPSHTYSSGGNYTVCLSVTAANGCTNDTCITILNVGIEEGILTASSLLLYPNPAKDQLNVSLLGTESIGEIAVMDITGKSVLMAKGINNNIHTLDIQGLPKGMYILHVTSSQGGKVVKRFTVL